MKKMFKRFVTAFVTMSMLAGITVSAYATQTGTVSETENIIEADNITETQIVVNPIYADVITSEELEEIFKEQKAENEEAQKGRYFSAPSTTFTSMNQLGEYLRGQEKIRETEVICNVDLTVTNPDFTEAINISEKHTGNPIEGDYLKFNRLGYGFSTTYSIVNGHYVGTVTFDFTYCASRQQEQKVTDTLPSVMSSLSLNGKSEEEKVKAIYSYITKNVTYDWDHLNDNSYTLKHSTYAALINKTAVCQGYATLFYRMALEAGLDSRVIAGKSDGGNHAWNIVKLGSVYYNVDVTFDSGKSSSESNWSYYLKSNSEFPKHDRDSEYTTSSFNSSYPISSTSYTGSSSGSDSGSGSGGDGTYRDLVWEYKNGKSYWYENNVRQGTYSDTKCFSFEGTLRGREIYDPASNGWYWLDVNADGAKAVGKEVFMPYIYQTQGTWSEDEINSNAAASGAYAEGNIEHAELADQVKEAIHNKTGKWVRYDNNGMMLKGWVKIEGELAVLYPDQAGNVYYYDRKTGLMAKGLTVIGGTTYYFDEITGVLK